MEHQFDVILYDILTGNENTKRVPEYSHLRQEAGKADCTARPTL